MYKFNGNTRYLNEELTLYSEKLIGTFRNKYLNKLFFVNSGSAASDLSLRISQKFNPTKNMIIVM